MYFGVYFGVCDVLWAKSNMMEYPKAAEFLSVHGPRWVEIGLVVLFGWMVSGWLVAEGLPEHGDEAGFATINSVSQAIPDVASLIQAPLFGQVAKTVPKPAPVQQPVVQSRLNIKLLGTVVAGKTSAAVVKLASGRQQVFFIGDAIQPGVKLAAVEVDAIVVARNGRRERINMEKNAQIRQAAPVTAVRPMQPNVRRQVNRRHLQSQIQDFPKLLSQARVIPHFIDGKADGFVISDIVPGSLYQQVGLQNGDIIRRVNGQQVTSAQQAMAMYQALQNAPSIDVELMRAGQVQTVHYDIR